MAEGMPWEPFPRQVLISMGGASPPYAVYRSEIIEATAWKSITYRVDVYYSLPGTMAPQVNVNFETSGDIGFQAPVDLIPGGADAAVGNPASGTASDPLRYVRARVYVQQASEIVLTRVACVLRTQ